MSNYKNSLNLPKTNFSMKGSLTQKEPVILEKWKKNNLYEKIQKKNKDKPYFILLDGPPYANGNIHLGHALNKILKDIIIKSKNLSGLNTPFIPTWDCHGLPIEQKVEEKIKKNKKIVSKKIFRLLCKKYVDDQIKNQKKDFISLGILADWENSYITMNKKSEANTITSLYAMIKKKYLYKGLRPIFWCIKCNSALADTEVEYFDKQSDSITILFKIINHKKLLEKFTKKNILIEKIYLSVWTTTPWTLPSNQALAVNPKFEYQLIKNKKYGLILEKNSVINFLNNNKHIKYKIVGTIQGIELKKNICKHPFLNFSIPILLSDHVTLETGTGIVHIAPDHGYEDYLICKKNNIKIKNLVNGLGFFKTKIHPLLDEIHIFKSNKIIIDILKKEKKIISYEKIKHSYPCCWRHKTEIIFRTTPQWFININNNKLQKIIKKFIQKTEWNPSWGKNRMLSLSSVRPDWCISRQRNWGVPICIFIDKKTGNMHPKTLYFMKKIHSLIKKNGIESWWKLKKEDILNAQEINQYSKVYDVLDVWFESGSVNIHSVYKKYHLSKNQQADLYLEGSDQYRGWFMSSLIIASVRNNKSTPFKKIISHGFIVDKQGNKMSKSVGNIISPNFIIKKFGSDILRLWVASTNYSKNVNISSNILKQISEKYRKIRNTVRFLISNLYDFQPDINFIKIDNMIELDQWIIDETYKKQKKIINLYDKYNFHKVVYLITKFCTITLSAFYLDIVKDRLYTLKKNSIERRSCQTAIYIVLQSFVRWIAPILSFTADEIWDFIPNKNNKKYIFMEEWFMKLSTLSKKNILSSEDWNLIIQIKNEVNKVLEHSREKKIIKNSLEAFITIYVDKNIQTKINKLKSEKKFIFLTSKFSVKEYLLAPPKIFKSTTIKNLKIKIKKIEGIKCTRCWHYFIHTNNNTKNHTICDRCINNTQNIGEKRKFV
ncbi:isoleucine--tRNA ligase [Buchnera aphidicola (Kurisakia onigurumii)]|uniref:isoleucine--tRNA ligase n=1 Tax=Buchnera aphidicola TaxID=9 RepID=UPI0031B71FCF